ncbi:MAG: DNA replication/repair protein RecF [Clostridia bacterium]|nr:DNA replication/repair protein RecF [Clostridia bacterium]
MRIESLRTVAFRNLRDCGFEPGPTVNILYGDNAQGKTNLLEAAWLFTGSRSFRGAADHEMIRIGSEKSALAMNFIARNAPSEAKIDIQQRRSATLNGVSLESAARLAGEFCCVIFSPEHLGLVKEGPQLRRKFLDAAICPLWPRHASNLFEYNRVLAQRNALLKDVQNHSELMDTLSVWDEKLAALGGKIIFTRLRYLARLAPKAQEIYGGITQGKEPLKITYRCGSGAQYDCQLDSASESQRVLYALLLEGHRSSLHQDMEVGWTHTGPHRDDLVIDIEDLSARLYGSQGQQRSAVLALKLAEASVLGQALSEAPVLLLDDVMSELDRSRQEYLLNHIGGWQVLITCCDPAGLEVLSDGRIFEVKKGAATRIN